MAENRLYPEKYGAWAGYPQGHAPDYARCCEEVWSKDRWSRASQCGRKRGHGPDSAYCRQHDPEAAAKRQREAAERGAAKWRTRLLEIYGKTFYDALVKIASGHNDARGLAQEALDKFNNRTGAQASGQSEAGSS